MFFHKQYPYKVWRSPLKDAAFLFKKCNLLPSERVFLKKKHYFCCKETCFVPLQLSYEIVHVFNRQSPYKVWRNPLNDAAFLFQSVIFFKMV
jgi:hypothetical protein